MIEVGSEVKAVALPGKGEFYGTIIEIIDPHFGQRLFAVRDKFGEVWLRTFSEIFAV